MNSVWVSRPRRRTLPLARALRRHNLTPIVKPAIRIVAAKQRDSLNQFVARLRFFDLAIFVSEEAAHRCRDITPPNSPLPSLSVGAATFAAVKKNPAFAAIETSADDSDSLLRLSHLQNIAEKKIAVVGGISGEDADSLSPKLCRGLQKRGAKISRVAAYRRIPAPPDAEISRLVSEKTLRAAIAYSGDTAANMRAMLAPLQRDSFLRIPLFVIHRNIAAAAQKAGFRDVHIAPPDAEKMASQIAAHLQTGE